MDITDSMEDDGEITNFLEIVPDDSKSSVDPDTISKTSLEIDAILEPSQGGGGGGGGSFCQSPLSSLDSRSQESSLR